MNENHSKLLIIRFSSFGDIVQGISVPAHFAKTFPRSEIHWLVREDFADLLRPQISLQKVIPFSRKLSVWQLIKTSWQLSADGYTHVYDAHNNLRSNVVMAVFVFRAFSSIFTHALKGFRFLRRPKNRLKRFLLFKLRINQFENPFIAARSFLDPLKKWGVAVDPKNLLGESHFQISPEAKLKADQILKQLSIQDFISIAPSAAWPMKRWPVSHWKTLVQKSPDQNFVILGGPEDTFCEEIVAVAPDRVFNLCGKLSLIESCAIVERSRQLISGDTGLLHVADQMQKKVIALMGPTAFGYPASRNATSLHTNLYCQPCSKDGRGKCYNDLYQRCLVELSPELVSETAKRK